MSQPPRNGARTIGSGKPKGDKEALSIYVDRELAVRFRRFMFERQLSSGKALELLMEKAGVP